MRVVVDPNVLLSALIAPGGTSDKAVRALATGATLIVSEQLLDRFVQRASGKRFRRWFSVADARELADRLSDLAETVIAPDDVPAVVEADPSDDYLVALARHARAQRLVTGDHGIRRSLENATDLRVVSPGEILEELASQADDPKRPGH